MEIIEFAPVSFDARKGNGKFEKVGHIKVRGAKQDLWLEAIKGEKGGVFFRIPNIKVGDKWEAAYSYHDHPEFTKMISKELGEVFKAKYM